MSAMRGILIGLAITLPLWVMVALLAKAALS